MTQSESNRGDMCVCATQWTGLFLLLLFHRLQLQSEGSEEPESRSDAGISSERE